MAAPEALEHFNVEDELSLDSFSIQTGNSAGKPGVPPELPYVGFPKRAVAWVIDGTLVITASIGTAAILGIIIGLTVYPLCPNVSLASAIATYAGYVVGLGVYVLYYVGFECSHLQATPGKLLFSLRVTDLKGNKITPGRSLYRLVGKFLSGFLFCFGFFLCGITERKQTLHDILAHTLVLNRESD